MDEASDPRDRIECTAEIVSAYVSRNSVPAEHLVSLINDVHTAVVRVSTAAAAPMAEAPRPAVSPKKSITDEFLVCLEDGRPFKSLKRHLRARYNMSPEEYRAKWGLPPDYPMVAPSYAKARSMLAKEMGLGQQRHRSP